MRIGFIISREEYQLKITKITMRVNDWRFKKVEKVKIWNSKASAPPKISAHIV